LSGDVDIRDDDEDIESGAVGSAPDDPIIAAGLDAPTQAIDIYLEEASTYRPISTGDIFQGVDVPGSTPDEAVHDLTMLVAHPSAMRKGAVLEARARAAPVTPVDGLSKRNWKPGFYNVFPLPSLSTVASGNGFAVENRGWGAQLELAAPVQTADLDVTKRVACLSPEGVHLLLQRLVHADTRFPVRTSLLADVFAPKLNEIEMLETWNEELVAPRVENGAELAPALSAAAQEFDDALGSITGTGGRPVRDMIGDDTHAGEAERLIARERLRRRTELEKSFS